MEERQVELQSLRRRTPRPQRNSDRSSHDRLPRSKKGEHFLKGPIPLNWLTAAARLPGKALHVAIALWFRAGLTRSGRVPLSNLAVEPFGVERDTKRRALRHLEAEGLISVERPPNASPVVSLQEVPSGCENAPGSDDEG